jgi:hypothetical protein
MTFNLRPFVRKQKKESSSGPSFEELPMKDIFHTFLYVMAFFLFIGCLSMITNPEATAVKVNRITQSLANIYHSAETAFQHECK